MKKEIQKMIEKAILSLKLDANLDLCDILVDYPKDENFGDYSTNVALILGKKSGKNPLEVAENIKKEIESSKSENIANIEVVKPGFINFYLAPKYFQEVVEKINKEKENFGNSEIGKGIKINNEFISANPTGPLHLGNGRGGFFGDSLSRVFRKAGFSVVSEYYVNDGGVQVEKLGHSVLKDEEVVYGGEYIEELNKKYGKLSVEEAGEKAANDILENIIKPTVKEKMQIAVDEWASERKEVIEKGYIEKALEILKEKALIYEAEEALWFKSTEFGDDKDRVLIKKDGQKTYLASDCGYILNKIERGFDKIIEIWGADHHGYINRFQAVASALGFKNSVDFIIVQLVRLVKDGKEVRMSKRAGNVVYIDELIEKVGHDVARFFFLMYSPDTHLNFDLGLAEERSQKNPVYYVQYAHARICSILSKSQIPNPKSQTNSNPESSGQNPKTETVDLSLLQDEKELSLMRELDKFPELLEEIAKSYEVQKFPHYAIKIADKFHSFYNACQVIDAENLELTKARLKLINAVKIVLGETLSLIGVSAPEKM